MILVSIVKEGKKIRRNREKGSLFYCVGRKEGK